MEHYHGTPMGGKLEERARWMRNRDVLIPFRRPEDLPIACDVSRSFILDNSAYSCWREGEPMGDWGAYYKWVRSVCRHPGFRFCLIPDVIGGDEKENDALIADWERRAVFSFTSGGIKTKRYPEAAPVWHLHESLERLQRLCARWRTVALGSSGQWATPGTQSWWQRISDAMDAICDDDGRPPCRLHGLRMLNPAVFSGLPLASADSTNVARHSGSVTRAYIPPSRSQRMATISDRIETHNSAGVWKRRDKQLVLMEV